MYAKLTNHDSTTAKIAEKHVFLMVNQTNVVVYRVKPLNYKKEKD